MKTQETIVNAPRAFSLDALRGYAILTMVLSANIAFGILPAWMYHAQTPPPSNQFDPSVFGITWVDLVFPFFLFAMGAAFPFSIGKKAQAGASKAKLIIDSLKRGAKLVFFAVFIQHMYPHVLSSPQDYRAWFLSILAFILMFPMFMRLPWKMKDWLRYLIQFLAYALAVFLLLSVDYARERVFNLNFSNIIILVLANMAVFGSLVYLFTINNHWKRLLVLPFVMAIFLGASSSPDSWNAWVYNYSPVPWMYSFRFLKYLFIIIPGSMAGEYLFQWMQTYRPADQLGVRKERLTAFLLSAICLALIVFNLYGLFSRHLVLNLVVSSLLLVIGGVVLREQSTSYGKLWNRLFLTGAVFLLLGLFFEAYEGGIRKDSSTYSYYFVTSGLAFMALIVFSVLCDYFNCRKSTSFLVMAGQNPMIAYVAPSMVVLPILKILNLMPFLNAFGANAWLGFLRGLVITALVTLLTMFFTKIKWFWRT